ncbi:hypothetical protein, conserved [Eimeria brunetti]|uniref:Uncharacterized protein n=1 Tax=Eimeria brunetti TaxID=51314 RepID=U6L753_9EIME|nr:hypothetical protein, conserved [Eimeria brunetti]
MESGRPKQENLFLVHSKNQQICRSGYSGGSGSVSKLSGIEALNPTQDPIYCGTLPPVGVQTAKSALGPIQPPKRSEGIWLQDSRYGGGVAVEDIIDYIVEQLPPPLCPPGPMGWVQEEEMNSLHETEPIPTLGWLTVEPSLALETIHKILSLHLLNSNTSRSEVEALVHYYIKWFIEERELSLPYLPKVDRGLLCFWKP